MLSSQDIALVKESIPLLENTGTALTEHFYARLFHYNPELKNVFNLSHQHSGKQPVALFNAVAAYAKNIENPAALSDAVKRIAHKHTSFNIRPEHYPIVGQHLIGTLQELGGEAFSKEMEQAWSNAYSVLSTLFIDQEDTLYHTQKHAHGGWEGARKFRLIDKRYESELVKSFVFEPTDLGPVAKYKPGQYLGIKLNIDGHPHQEIRQYSLSQAANRKSYQISVKREEIGVPGVVSNYLHDYLALGAEVELFSPAGDFHFEDRNSPVALISAGVGITPMMAILESLTEQEYSHDIFFLHACENVNQYSFSARIAQATEAENIDSYTWFKSEEPRSSHEFKGLMDLISIKEKLPLENGHFYLCGPVAFMQFAKGQLRRIGVEDDRIHYEVFGPHETF